MNRRKRNFRNFSDALDLGYNYHQNRAVLEFEDGVEYTMTEAMLLRKEGNPINLQAIHNVKKIFDGVLMTENDVEHEPWREYVNSESRRREIAKEKAIKTEGGLKYKGVSRRP